MKLFLALLLFVSSLTVATAQYSDPAVPAAAATTELAEKYQLTEAQQVQMQAIQTRYFTNLTKLEKLEDTDVETYVQKRKALQTGTQGSIKLLLTKDQLPAFDRERRDRRRRQAEMVQALAKQGKSELEIQRAILEVE